MNFFSPHFPWLSSLIGLLFLSTAPALPAATAKHPDAAALAVLDRLSAFYKRVASFSVHLQMQVTPATTQTPQLLNSGALTVAKPNRVRIAIREGERDLRVVSDGTRLSTLLIPANEYRQTVAPDTLAPVMRGLAPGLESLLEDDPKTAILDHAQNLSMAGQETISGQPCTRLRFERGDVGVELLVQNDPQPLLRRLTLHRASGETLELRCDDWRINPQLGDKAFQFVPPAGAKEVRPAPELPFAPM